MLQNNHNKVTNKSVAVKNTNGDVMKKNLPTGWRREASKVLNISLSTVDDWYKKTDYRLMEFLESLMARVEKAKEIKQKIENPIKK
jgi:hypothetical protein